MEENFSLLYNVKHTHARFSKDLLFFELREKRSLSPLSLCFSLCLFKRSFSVRMSTQNSRGNTQPNATNVRRTKERKNRRPFVPSLFRVSNPKSAQKIFQHQTALLLLCCGDHALLKARENAALKQGATRSEREYTAHIIYHAKEQNGARFCC